MLTEGHVCSGSGLPFEQVCNMLQLFCFESTVQIDFLTPLNAYDPFCGTGCMSASLSKKIRDHRQIRLQTELKAQG